MGDNGASHSKGSLRDSWYPVTLSTDVQDKPVGVRLLDTDVVLWRTAGEPTWVGLVGKKSVQRLSHSVVCSSGQGQTMFEVIPPES